ncbi:hypothetical protein NCC49_005940 [Naganishia albida]|nr:hypothetical protein NCC49_005940 [Naganishia albida]
MSKRKPASIDTVKAEAEKPAVAVKEDAAPRKRQKTTTTSSPSKRVKRSRSASSEGELVAVKDAWPDWPAPREAIDRARDFILEIAKSQRRVLLMPDKDADGLTSGYVLHKTLELLGLPPSNIFVHVLSKGTNVHSPNEIDTVEKLVEQHDIERVVVLDQGSRPGPVVRNLKDGLGAVLVIDHHQSDEFPDGATILTACKSSPIANASLLTYLTCLPLHSEVQEKTDWAALMGTVGDLGTGIKWKEPPWPAHIAQTSKTYGSKVIADAVGAINAPRRTAEYNVKKAWDILIAANNPREVANNAWLKLCRLDVNEEIEKWGRQPPRFSEDGKVALVRVATGFQVHPVVATRWAGTLRKAKTLVMVMCANTAFNPDPGMVSFSCRLSSALRELPEAERPSLIDLLKSYGDKVEGFKERVGDNFARGHNEATGGIIRREEFEKLLTAMGIDGNKTKSPAKSATKTGKGKVIDPKQKNGIKDFFKVAPPPATSVSET